MNSESVLTHQKPFNTAVLFLVFNRLDTAKEVFNAIRRARPPRLYIACDGARNGNEAEKVKVKELREYLTSNIDWKCEVNTLFRDKNLGCKLAVSSAIDWFFKHEEMGIIFEDDTLPDPSFFHYSEQLLVRYKDDQRVGMISGNNHIDYVDSTDSYMFSKYMWTWGWATWRRAWANYDIEMTFLDTSQKESIISGMGYGSRTSREYWEAAIDSMRSGKVNTWDYQWFFSLAAQNQLCIFPNGNLVSNIGFGGDATHCTGEAPDNFTKLDTLTFPLKHPKYVVPNIDFELKYKKSLLPETFRRTIKRALLKMKII
jgi:hypothetical protein